MNNWLNIRKVEPLRDVPVLIKTNWSIYEARLHPSNLGGVEFHVHDRQHAVQLTTVTGWKSVA